MKPSREHLALFDRAKGWLFEQLSHPFAGSYQKSESPGKSKNGLPVADYRL
jgi:hypothetical protein